MIPLGKISVTSIPKVCKKLGNYIRPWKFSIERFYIRYSPIRIFKSNLWKRARHQKKQFVARTNFGILISGNSADFVQGYIYYFGVWEPNLTAFVKRRLKNTKGRTFIDVGANIGYYSLLASSQMQNGYVVAIEAFPGIYEKLIGNIDINKQHNIRAILVAAAEEDCNIDIYYAGPHNEGATTTVTSLAKTGTPVTVRGKPLSELLSEEEVRTMLMMKIDVEGAELSVINGMLSLFDKFQPDVEFIVEVIPKTLGKVKLESLFRIFEEAGFNAYKVENSYEPEFYLEFSQISRPVRINLLPAEESDIIFSKIDSKYL